MNTTHIRTCSTESGKSRSRTSSKASVSNAPMSPRAPKMIYGIAGPYAANIAIIGAAIPPNRATAEHRPMPEFLRNIFIHFFVSKNKTVTECLLERVRQSRHKSRHNHRSKQTFLPREK